MTLEELNRMQHLRKLIETLKARLDVGSPGLEWSPHGSGHSDKLGRLVPQLVELTEEYNRLAEWIHSIRDYRIQLICILRFEDGLSWMDVAEGVGENETEYGVKKALCRYLDKTQSGRVAVENDKNASRCG